MLLLLPLLLKQSNHNTLFAVFCGRPTTRSRGRLEFTTTYTGRIKEKEFPSLATRCLKFGFNVLGFLRVCFSWSLPELFEVRELGRRPGTADLIVYSLFKK